MTRTIDVSLPPPPPSSPSQKQQQQQQQQQPTKLYSESSSPSSSQKIRISTSHLPKPWQRIPPEATDLAKCALHQIRSLILTTTTTNTNTNTTASSQHTFVTEEDEDALDDGFLLCDLTVIQRKLEAWRLMFPRIKPFFALKCNPDAMVASVLGKSSLEEDGVVVVPPPQPEEEEEEEDSLSKNLVGFDCASISEIKLALASCRADRSTTTATTTTTTTTNYQPTNESRRCLYANPQRAESELTQSLDLGVEGLTFDGIEELHKVSRAHKLRLARWNNHNNNHNNHNESQRTDPPLPPEMILRILVPDTTSSVPLGEKFGAAPSTIPQLVHTALDLGLPVVGVSFHCGSGCHDPEAYGTAVRIAKDALDVIRGVLEERGVVGWKCSVLDIGGGYPGWDGVGGDWGRFSGGVRKKLVIGGSNGGGGIEEEEMEDVDTAYKISQVVNPLLDELFPPAPLPSSSSSSSATVTSENETVVHPPPIQIIAEPGRYFVEAAFAYCAKIYTIRVENEEGSLDDGVVGNETTMTTTAPTKTRRHYYIAQGVRGLFKDVLLCGEVFTPIPLIVDEPEQQKERLEQNQKEEDQLYSSTVHGPSGEDFDIVCPDCRLPALNIGDWLIFDRMGAYTLSIAARNSCLPIRYVIGNDG